MRPPRPFRIATENAKQSPLGGNVKVKGGITFVFPNTHTQQREETHTEKSERDSNILSGLDNWYNPIYCDVVNERRGKYIQF